MRKSKRTYLLLAACVMSVFSVVMLQSCSNDDENKDDETEFPEPAITGLSNSFGYPGDEVIIKGVNFDTVVTENVVTFGEYEAEVMAEGSSTTQLTVKQPKCFMENVYIFVTSHSKTAKSEEDYSCTY